MVKKPRKLKKKDKPAGRKQSIIAGIIILILMIVAGIAMFGILFSQEKIDEGPMKRIEKQKKDKIDSIDKAIQVLESFSNLPDDFSTEQLPKKLFDLIREKLNIANLTELPVHEEGDNKGFESVFDKIKTKCPSAILITELSDFIKLLNNGTGSQREQLKKITGPIIAYNATFVDMLKKESEKPGTLSKNKLVEYLKSIIIMLKEYKRMSVARYDSIIQSYQKQIDSRKSADLGHLLVISIFSAISFILFGANIILFLLFQNEKISLETLKRHSKILVIVSVIIALGLLIYAIMGSIGLSPFGYDCKLKREAQTSDKKFTNFDGKVSDLGSITSDCKKGETIYSKMVPQLNAENIRIQLDKLKDYVITFAESINFKAPLKSAEISDLSRPLDNQNDELLTYKKKPCMKKVMTYLNDMLEKLGAILQSLELMKQRSKQIPDVNLKPDVDKLIDESFENLKTVSKNSVDSLNEKLDSTDIPCYQEIPAGLCDGYQIYFNNAMIVNWIMFGVSLLIVLLSKLLYCIPKSIIRKSKQVSEKMDEKKKKEEDKNIVPVDNKPVDELKIESNVAKKEKLKDEQDAKESKNVDASNNQLDGTKNESNEAREEKSKNVDASNNQLDGTKNESNEAKEGKSKVEDAKESKNLGAENERLQIENINQKEEIQQLKKQIETRAPSRPVQNEHEIAEDRTQELESPTNSKKDAPPKLKNGFRYRLDQIFSPFWRHGKECKNKDFIQQGSLDPNWNEDDEKK